MWIDITDVVMFMFFIGVWKNNIDGVDVDVLFLRVWIDNTDVVDVHVLFLGDVEK